MNDIVENLTDEEIDLLISFLEMVKGGYNLQPILDIAKRHKVSFLGCVFAYMRCRRSGADNRQAILALRVGAAIETKQREWFSSDDLACAIGVPPNEAQKLVENAEEHITVSFAPWLIN